MKIRSINDLKRYGFPLHIQKQIIDGYRKTKTRHRVAGSSSHMESPSRNDSVGSYAGPSFNSFVHIDIYSRRKAKTDIDNISGKAALDGIVNAGILTTDSPDQITRYQVHKPEISFKEETVIIIEEE